MTWNKPKTVVEIGLDPALLHLRKVLANLIVAKRLVPRMHLTIKPWNLPQGNTNNVVVYLN